VVTWCHLGIPLRQMLLQLRTHIQQGVLSNCGYAHAGWKLSDGSHVAKYWHHSTRDANTSVDTHTPGDTLKLGIHSHWRHTVRRHSCREVTASIYNRRGYMWGYTYNWETLNLGIHSHWGRTVRWQLSGIVEKQENGGRLLYLGFLDFSIVVFYLIIWFLLNAEKYRFVVEISLFILAAVYCFYWI